ncbi:hypothetical protein K438DRAFT_1759309 [Mycena galopus ATCC 62051]|nr:hypothetical protein K438DRAFT_1759309 [Mycena galopus ATCC 62051]
MKYEEWSGAHLRHTHVREPRGRVPVERRERDVVEVDEADVRDAAGRAFGAKSMETRMRNAAPWPYRQKPPPQTQVTARRIEKATNLLTSITTAQLPTPPQPTTTRAVRIFCIASSPKSIVPDQLVPDEGLVRLQVFFQRASVSGAQVGRSPRSSDPPPRASLERLPPHTLRRALNAESGAVVTAVATSVAAARLRLARLGTINLRTSVTAAQLPHTPQPITITRAFRIFCIGDRVLDEERVVPRELFSDEGFVLGVVATRWCWYRLRVSRASATNTRVQGARRPSSIALNPSPDAPASARAGRGLCTQRAAQRWWRLWRWWSRRVTLGIGDWRLEAATIANVASVDPASEVALRTTFWATPCLQASLRSSASQMITGR